MGLLRLFLAVCVIAAHSGTPLFGENSIGPFQAVNFFFVISGFYMAMILTEKYKDPVPVDFYKNRLLRLMPTFYLVALIGLAISWRALAATFGAVDAPGKILMVFQQLFLVPQDLSYLVCVRLHDGTCIAPNDLSGNPPTWTLAVEIGFYVVAPLIVRSIRRSYIFVLIGVAYLALVAFMSFPAGQLPFINPYPDNTSFTYNFYPSSFVYFGMGAIAYHLGKTESKLAYLPFVVLVPLLALTDTFIPFWQLIVMAAAVPVLFRLTGRNRLDRLIGELSYPVYVLHWPILVGMLGLAAAHPAPFAAIPIGVWVTVAAIGGAVIIHFSLERWIGSFRSRIGERALVSQPAIAESPQRQRSLGILRTWFGVYAGAPFVLVLTLLALQHA